MATKSNRNKIVDPISQVNRELKKISQFHPDFRSEESGEYIFLLNPWNDKSVALIAHKDGKINKDLFKVLRNIEFPQELSAIFHLDRRVLEVIWTSYKLNQTSADLIGRSFDFTYKSNSHACRFDSSSAELLTIAKSAAYLQVSQSSFRNLQSFSSFTKMNGVENSRFGEPVSFFIEDMPEDRGVWLDIIKHLNFYLRYYDSKSPHVVIHETVEERSRDRVRYIEGSFPRKINSRSLNSNLLSFWLAAYDHDITTRFLLYYRILEYVSALYLQSKQRQDLLRVLNSPSALSSLDGTLDAVASIVRQDNLPDIDRYIKMIEELVDKRKIWSEINENRDCFEKNTCFEGGLQINALISANTKEEDFSTKEMQLMARSLRNIRHALAHGGEVQAGKLILPTRENFQKLVPWMHLAMVAAGEVVLYEHLS